jgi:hypothetical protein
MVTSNYFFIIFLSTVLIIRLFLFVRPISSPTISGFRIHHYMYGVVGIVIGLLVHFILVYAIGLGLFIDELTYLIIRGKNHADNYSRISLFGTLVFVIIVFIFKSYLVLPFRLI